MENSPQRIRSLLTNKMLKKQGTKIELTLDEATQELDAVQSKKLIKKPPKGIEKTKEQRIGLIPEKNH